MKLMSRVTTAEQTTTFRQDQTLDHSGKLEEAEFEFTPELSSRLADLSDEQLDLLVPGTQIDVPFSTAC
jgi:hypothetical protein